MRIVLLALISLGMGFWEARADEGWKQGWAENLFKDPKTGQIELSKDFGTVPRGTQLYHRFRIKNIYQVPLQISATVGCTCLSVNPATQVLQSLQEGYIDVFMDASKFKGQRTSKVNITVGPDFISSTSLQLSAFSRADIVLNPGQMTFGVVTSGGVGSSQTLDIEYAGELNWQITGLAKNEAPVDLTVNELYRKPGQVGYRVTATIRADAPPGSFKHELFFQSNDPASPLVPVLVEGIVQAVQGGLSAVPDTLDMGRLKIGESSTKLVLVRATKPFRITGLEGAGNGVSAEIRQEPNKVQVVKVRYQPPQPEDLHRQLRIKTDLRPEPVVVTIQGAGEALQR
jgi:hypothetical protein